MNGKKADKNWLDLIIGVSAMIIAIVSLLVSLRQSQIMDRQLAASVWPHLQYDTSNESEDGKKAISFDVENAGVGPAIIHAMTIRYKDHPVRNVMDLFTLCCADLLPTAAKPYWTTNVLHHHVLIPGHSQSFLVLPDRPGNDVYWQRLNAERYNLHVRICYCSVLGQCWMEDSNKPEQQQLSACPADTDDDYRN